MGLNIGITAEEAEAAVEAEAASEAHNRLASGIRLGDEILD